MAKCTAEEAIQTVARKAEELMRDGTPAAHRLILLREAADATDTTIRDTELKRLLVEARRSLLGTFDAITDRPLSLAPTPWLWEGLVMPEAFNMLLALAKVGKTSLVLEALGNGYMELPTSWGNSSMEPVFQCCWWAPISQKTTGPGCCGMPSYWMPPSGCCPPSWGCTPQGHPSTLMRKGLS